MEVGVKIIAENVLSGAKRHTNSCYVTYVALDDNGLPTPVPPIIPETADEKRRYERAAQRRASRGMERRYDQGRGGGEGFVGTGGSGTRRGEVGIRSAPERPTHPRPHVPRDRMRGVAVFSGGGAKCLAPVGA